MAEIKQFPARLRFRDEAHATAYFEQRIEREIIQPIIDKLLARMLRLFGR